MTRPALAVGATLLALILAATPGCAAPGRGSAAAVALPPSGDTAMDALVASPRHGEWVDVPAPAGDDAASVRAWVVYPERPGPAPVVLVVHEIMGLSDWIRSVADELAAEGYVAVAPDLLSGKGPGDGGSATFSGDAVRAAIRALDRAEVNARLDAVRAWALARPSTSRRVAVTGFCWGGSTTFAYAAHQPGLDAAIVWYGTAPADEELAQIAAPVLGLYGGDDARVTSTVAPTESAMRAAGKAYTARVFAGAGHGFLRQQAARDGANRAAAMEGWTAALDLLGRATR